MGWTRYERVRARRCGWRNAPACEKQQVVEIVMPGLVPGIHAFILLSVSKTWMAGTGPAMTRE
jgi:hypothetical protein